MNELHNTIILSTLGDASTPCFHPWRDIAIPAMVSDPRIVRSGLGGARLPPPTASAESAMLLGTHATDGDAQRFAEDPYASIKERNVFAYFQGSLNWFDGEKSYSRGVRQVRSAPRRCPRARPLIGSRGGTPQALREVTAGDPLFKVSEGKVPDYVDNLKRSVFCICPLGASRSLHACAHERCVCARAPVAHAGGCSVRAAAQASLLGRRASLRAS